MATRTLHVIVCETGEPFDVATWDGLAHAELQGAVAARGGLCPASLYCTFARDRRGPVAPLSASLPDGATLYAHGAPVSFACAAGGAAGTLAEALAHAVARPSTTQRSQLFPPSGAFAAAQAAEDWAQLVESVERAGLVDADWAKSVT